MSLVLTTDYPFAEEMTLYARCAETRHEITQIKRTLEGARWPFNLHLSASLASAEENGCQQDLETYRNKNPPF